MILGRIKKKDATPEYITVRPGGMGGQNLFKSTQRKADYLQRTGVETDR